MNLITNTTKSMSLKDITDLLETRHNDAMKVVEKMAESPEFGAITKISYSFQMPNNAVGTKQTYALNKRQSIAVAAKLNTTLLMRVIDRWQELEAKQLHPNLPKNYKEALLAIVVEVDKNEQLQQQVIALQPKAEAFERLSEAKGCELITNTAKILKLHPQMLFNKLQELGWIYRRGKNKQWVGYEDKIHLGLVEHVYTTTNNNWAYMQVLITPKGVTKLSNILNKVAA